MRVIIAGSRSSTCMLELESAIRKSGFEITMVISGCARGADRLGEIWAKLNGIPVESFPAHWDEIGKRAGFVRNQEMSEVADALIALWDGESNGTKHMISLMKHKQLPIHIEITL